MSTKHSASAPSAITRSPSKIIAMVDAIDAAYTHVLKLHALLSNTYGEAGDSFRNMADDLQDNYLWACADMAEAVKAALETSFDDVKS